MKCTPHRLNCMRILRASQTLMTRAGDSGSGRPTGKSLFVLYGPEQEIGRRTPNERIYLVGKRRLPDHENWGRVAKSSRPSYLPLSSPFS
jgi:hypothetical protein